MPKVTVGEGLVTHELDLDPAGLDPVDLELAAVAVREFARINPHDDRDTTAQELWSILDAAGVPRPSAELTSTELMIYWLKLLRAFSERSKEWHSAAWLRSYYDYQRVKSKLVASGVSETDLIYFSKFTDDMAVLKERMWWRVKPVKGTANKSAPLGKSVEG